MVGESALRELIEKEYPGLFAQERVPRNVGTASGQLTGEIESLGLELSNATASIYWIFVLQFCTHNPKVVSSNLTPATMGA